MPPKTSAQPMPQRCHARAIALFSVAPQKSGARRTIARGRDKVPTRRPPPQSAAIKTGGSERYNSVERNPKKVLLADVSGLAEATQEARGGSAETAAPREPTTKPMRKTGRMAAVKSVPNKGALKFPETIWLQRRTPIRDRSPNHPPHRAISPAAQGSEPGTR